MTWSSWTLVSRVAMFCVLSASAACCAQGAATWQPTWDHDGLVTTGARTIQAPVQLVTCGVLLGDDLFLGGDQRKADGEQVPYLVRLGERGDAVEKWRVASSVQALFVHKGVVHALLNDGQIVRFLNGQWAESALKAEPEARLISSSPPLVVCSPRPLLMADRRRGACYSLEQCWRQEVNWFEVQPIVCEGTLLAIEQRFSKHYRTSINVHDGAMTRTQLRRPPKKLRCPEAKH